MEAFDNLVQPLCDYNESMDALPELWESESFESEVKRRIIPRPLSFLNTLAPEAYLKYRVAVIRQQDGLGQPNRRGSLIAGVHFLISADDLSGIFDGHRERRRAPWPLAR